MVSPTVTFTGLSSGLDTGSLVTSLMQLERAPINRLNVQRAQYENKRSAWTSINSKLSDFRTAVDAARDTSDFNNFVSASSSNTDAISVTKTGNPAPTSLSLTIEQLAATHQVTAGTGFADANAPVGTGTFSLDVGGTVTDFATDSETSLADLARQINSGDVGVTASVIQVGEGDARLLITADDSGSAGVFSATSDLAGFATIDTISAGQDAIARLGNPTTGLQLTRSTNVFTDVVEGLSFTAREVTSSPVTVAVERDVDAAAEAITEVFTKANALLKEIDRQTAYNAESASSSPLTNDRTARDMVLSLRNALSDVVSNSGPNSNIGDVGIEFERDGTYSVDADALKTALEENFAGVTSLFTSSTASSDKIQVLSNSSSTATGSYDVVVDTAPDIPSITGSSYVQPAALAELNIQYKGINALVTVSQNATLLQAIDSIRQGLDSFGLQAVTIDSVAVPGGDALRLSVPGAFGSAEELAIWNDVNFGLNAVANGVDIVGSIGGATTTGVGDVLQATNGEANGIRARLTVTAAEVGAGGFNAGTIGASQGLGGRLDAWLDRHEGIDGAVDRASGEWETRIEDIDENVAAYEIRMTLREAALRRQFTAMEQALSSLQNQSSFLTGFTPSTRNNS